MISGSGHRLVSVLSGMTVDIVNSSLDKVIDFIEKMYLALRVDSESRDGRSTYRRSDICDKGEQERWKENVPKKLPI